jgi:hypothetical protein
VSKYECALHPARDARCWYCRKYTALENETRDCCALSLKKALEFEKTKGFLPYEDTTAAGFLLEGVSLADARARWNRLGMLLDRAEDEANDGEPVCVPDVSREERQLRASLDLYSVVKATGVPVLTLVHGRGGKK